jgi:hypothetical protein
MLTTSSLKVHFFIIILFFAITLSGGCRTGNSNSNTQSPQAAATPQTAASPGAPAPVQVKPATPFSSTDVAKLKWVEGTWRASGEDMEPSYERYRFDDDKAIMIESFEDEKMDKPSESTRFELKDGEFTAMSGKSRWTANEITDDSVTFFRVSIEQSKPSNAPASHPPVEMPDYGPRSLRWQNNKDGTWKVTVDWPETGDQKAMQKSFVMERWPQGGQSQK